MVTSLINADIFLKVLKTFSKLLTFCCLCLLTEFGIRTEHLFVVTQSLRPRSQKTLNRPHQSPNNRDGLICILLACRIGFHPWSKIYLQLRLVSPLIRAAFRDCSRKHMLQTSVAIIGKRTGPQECVPTSWIQPSLPLSFCTFKP